MSIQTYPLIRSLNLKNLYYNVELIFDENAKNTKVIFEGIDHPEDIDIRGGSNLHIEQSSKRRDVHGDAGRTNHLLSGVAFFAMGAFRTPVQKEAKGKVYSEGMFRRTSKNFFKRAPALKSFLPRPVPAPHITIVTGPVDFTVHNCISVVGTMKGALNGNVYGSSYVNLGGVTKAELSVGDNAKVNLPDVDCISITASGSSNVQVAGITERSTVNAYNAARVTLKGDTIPMLRVNSTGDSDVRIIGEANEAYITSREQATVRVEGSCEASNIYAYGASKVFLSEGHGGNRISADALASVG